LISTEDQGRLVAVVHRDWDVEVTTPRFLEICTGKERGHRVADFAEERTLAFLAADGFPVAFESDKGGAPRIRSMGDVWLESGDPPIFNPINVKAGIAGTGGQPNMVSLTKLTEAILSHLIDSYWLLLIRFEERGSEFGSHVMLVNILDYLDFMHFDSGPGQIMLKSDAFYRHVAAGHRPDPLEIDEVVERLLEMRRDGDRRLAQNRAARFEQLETRAEAFDPLLPVNQSELRVRRELQ
jgi:hypothetical protein